MGTADELVEDKINILSTDRNLRVWNAYMLYMI